MRATTILVIVTMVVTLGAVISLIPIHQDAQAGKSIFSPPGPPGVPRPNVFSGWAAACHIAGSSSPPRGASDPHFCPAP